MYKHKIPLLPQELLGYHLGLTIAPKKRNLFWNPISGKRPPAGYGTQIDRTSYEINSVLHKLKIPLKVKVYPFGKFKTEGALLSFIADDLKKDKDLIVVLSSDVLNGTRKRNGHACVIDRFYSKRNTVRLIDPSSIQPKWREIPIDKFIKAIKFHPAGKGRILEFIKIS
jgi:hypothetical protein